MKTTTIYTVCETFNEVTTQVAFTTKGEAEKYIKERNKFFDEIEHLYKEHGSTSFVLPVLSIVTMSLKGIETIENTAIEEYLKEFYKRTEQTLSARSSLD